MIRKAAIPLIEKAITNGAWRKYMNPLLWQYPVNFPDTLLEMFKDAIPDLMDRMQALAKMTKDHVDNSQLELIQVPTSPNALMGQLEIILTTPIKVSPCVVFYQGEFWVQAQEFFPF
jgi:hypothetical protein